VAYKDLSAAAAAAAQLTPLPGFAASDHVHLTVELQLLAAMRSDNALGQLLTSSNSLLLQQLHEVFYAQQADDDWSAGEQLLVLRAALGRLQAGWR
jgi:hypothetical protein